jgi:hypothetical protein
MTLKRCSRGDACVHPDGPTLPATPEYFPRNRKNKDGLRYECKACANKSARRYREENPDKFRESQRQYATANAEKIREHHRQWYEEHRDERKRYARKYHAEHRDERIAQSRRYHAEHRDEAIARSRRYSSEHRDTERERARQYIAKNRSKVIERKRQYRINHPDKLKQYKDANRDKGRANERRRRTRKFSLPCTFTVADEARALEYWHGICPVCEEPLLDLFGEREPHLDHWIPISDAHPDNPGTVPENMIPLCNKCNTSKCASDPIEWLTRKFGKRKAVQIVKRIEAYFEYIRDQEDANDE